MNITNGNTVEWYIKDSHCFLRVATNLPGPRKSNPEKIISSSSDCAAPLHPAPAVPSGKVKCFNISINIVNASSTVMGLNKTPIINSTISKAQVDPEKRAMNSQI